MLVGKFALKLSKLICCKYKEKQPQKALKTLSMQISFPKDFHSFWGVFLKSSLPPKARELLRHFDCFKPTAQWRSFN